MSILMVLMFAFMLATLAVLLMGLVSMGVGGSFNERHGNKLMVARVTLQAITILLLGLVLLSQ